MTYVMHGKNFSYTDSAIVIKRFFICSKEIAFALCILLGCCRMVRQTKHIISCISFQCINEKKTLLSLFQVRTERVSISLSLCGKTILITENWKHLDYSRGRKAIRSL